MKKKIVAIILLIAMLSALSFVLAGCDEIVTLTIDGKYKDGLHKVSKTQESETFEVCTERVEVRFTDEASCGYHDFEVKCTKGPGIKITYGGKSYAVAENETKTFKSKLSAQGTFAMGVTGSPLAASKVKVTFKRSVSSLSGISESSGNNYVVENVGGNTSLSSIGAVAARPLYCFFLTPSGVKGEYENMKKNMEDDINDIDDDAISKVLGIMLGVPDELELIVDALTSIGKKEKELLKDIKKELKTFATNPLFSKTYLEIRVYIVESMGLGGLQYKYAYEVEAALSWKNKTLAPGFEGGNVRSYHYSSSGRLHGGGGVNF